jgi:hypothetical protein
MTDTTTPRVSGGASALAEEARERIASLRGRGRDAGGRATPGNTLAVKSGEYSTRIWRDPQVAGLLRQRVEDIRGELGADVSLIKHSVLETFARMEFLEDSLWANLMEHGAMTGKGRTRAAASLWLGVADRKAKLASQLGLDRVARKVPTPLDYMNGAERGV